VTWIAENDLFTFTTNEKDSTLNTATNRNLLKWEASLCDPLGFISPYIVRGKMLLQQCWLKGYDWDEEIHGELNESITES